MELKPIELLPKPENREDLGKRLDTLEAKANEVIRFINDRIKENSGGPAPPEQIEPSPAKTEQIEPGAEEVKPDIEASPEESKEEEEDLLNP